MKRTRFFQSLIGLALVAGLLTFTSQKAHAGWFWHSVIQGKYEGWDNTVVWDRPVAWDSAVVWGNSWRSGGWENYGGWYYRLGYRVFRPFWWRGWGSCCCSGSSGGWGSGGSSGGSPLYYSPGPTTPNIAPPATKPGAKNTNADNLPADTSRLSVHVPADAKIYINGKATSTPGTRRQFISRNLKPDLQYTYRVRAEVERDGKTLTETKIVDLRPGRAAEVAFDLGPLLVAKPKTITPKTITRVTIRLPADARLTISGSETRSTGAVREFTTGKLTGEQSWDNYTLRVVATRNGRQVTLEKTIELRAGESREVTFDFQASTVAAIDARPTR